VVEDYFRLALDALADYSTQTIGSDLMPTILGAACACLTLLKQEPLIPTLQFLRNFILYGHELSPTSTMEDTRHFNPPAVRQRVAQLISTQGEQLVQRVMTGMMYTFPENCFADASGILLELFPLMPQQVANWVQTTVTMLPAGSVTEQEATNLFTNLQQ
jgi:transportin-3